VSNRGNSYVCLQMVRGKEITPEVRAQVDILRQTGLKYRDIAQKLKISVAAAYKTVKRIEELQSFASRKRSGRRKVTTERDDRLISRIVKNSPKASSLSVKVRLPKTLCNVSTRTIRRRLFDNGLKSYTPARKPKLSAKNINDRLLFCKKYQNWTKREWENVMFSDESTFTQFYSYCRHVRRPPNKRYDTKYMVPTVRQAAKVMIWGAVSAAGRAGLWIMPKNTTINGKVYLGVLQDKLPNFMQIHGTTYFQHDGAPCHGTKPVTKWLHDTGYQILGPWPGSSPDLNVIENVWTVVKRKVADRNPTSAEDLQKKIKEAWISEITPEYCQKLVHSMPDRIAAVLKNKGNHSKY